MDDVVDGLDERPVLVVLAPVEEALALAAGEAALGHHEPGAVVQLDDAVLLGIVRLAGGGEVGAVPGFAVVGGVDGAATSVFGEVVALQEALDGEDERAGGQTLLLNPRDHAVPGAAEDAAGIVLVDRIALVGVAEVIGDGFPFDGIGVVGLCAAGPLLPGVVRPRAAGVEDAVGVAITAVETAAGHGDEPVLFGDGVEEDGGVAEIHVAGDDALGGAFREGAVWITEVRDVDAEAGLCPGGAAVGTEVLAQVDAGERGGGAAERAAAEVAAAVADVVDGEDSALAVGGEGRDTVAHHLKCVVLRHEAVLHEVVCQGGRDAGGLAGETPGAFGDGDLPGDDGAGEGDGGGFGEGEAGEDKRADGVGEGVAVGTRQAALGRGGRLQGGGVARAVDGEGVGCAGHKAVALQRQGQRGALRLAEVVEGTVQIEVEEGDLGGTRPIGRGEHLGGHARPGGGRGIQGDDGAEGLLFFLRADGIEGGRAIAKRECEGTPIGWGGLHTLPSLVERGLFEHGEDAILERIAARDEGDGVTGDREVGDAPGQRDGRVRREGPGLIEEPEGAGGVGRAKRLTVERHGGHGEVADPAVLRHEVVERRFADAGQRLRHVIERRHGILGRRRRTHRHVHGIDLQARERRGIRGHRVADVDLGDVLFAPLEAGGGGEQGVILVERGAGVIAVVGQHPAVAAHGRQEIGRGVISIAAVGEVEPVGVEADMDVVVAGLPTEERAGGALGQLCVDDGGERGCADPVEGDGRGGDGDGAVQVRAGRGEGAGARGQPRGGVGHGALYEGGRAFDDKVFQYIGRGGADIATDSDARGVFPLLGPFEACVRIGQRSVNPKAYAFHRSVFPCGGIGEGQGFVSRGQREGLVVEGRCRSCIIPGVDVEPGVVFLIPIQIEVKGIVAGGA